MYRDRGIMRDDEKVAETGRQRAGGMGRRGWGGN